MKWFKKILATLALVFLTSFAYSQGNATFNQNNYYQWVKVGTSKCNKANFYIYVDRVYNNASNLYYYNIYFWSDSYYKNCDPSSTYITNVNTFAYVNDGYSKVFENPYMLAKPKNKNFNGWNLLGYVYSDKSNINIKVTWGGTSLY